MHTLRRWGIPSLWGMAYAILVVLLSRLLLRSIGDLILLFGKGQDSIQQIAQVAMQLKTAELASPWVIPLLAGSLLGSLLGGFLKRPNARRWVCIVLAVVALIPSVALAVYFTQVNDIRLGNLLQILLPLLSAL